MAHHGISGGDSKYEYFFFKGHGLRAPIIGDRGGDAASRILGSEDVVYPNRNILLKSWLGRQRMKYFGTKVGQFSRQLKAQFKDRLCFLHHEGIESINTADMRPYIYSFGTRYSTYKTVSVDESFKT